jgi:hypothetical protein
MPITIILFLLFAITIIVTAVLLQKRKALMYAVIACEVLIFFIAFAVFVYAIEHNTM